MLELLQHSRKRRKILESALISTTATMNLSLGSHELVEVVAEAIREVI